MGIGEAMLADFEKERLATKRVLEAVPEGRMDWKPHEKSMSLGALAGHIAETPGWVRSMMEGDLDLASMAGSWRPFVPSSQRELLETFEKSVESFRVAVASGSDATFSETWRIRNGPKVLMEQPRHAAIRGNAIHHLIHHRGQLTVYLRLLGVAVPQTYGPSADFPGS
jgi:uncharacterized damage-inducible protein DinB